ncbi:MAG: D-serine ammonia-lyase [Spirochaeta sp. LUC14_002_19_P3]|nr:MAG: D-serine ammonia-lyase [Spirochaeta sp. LUC14_002_19_P3]
MHNKLLAGKPVSQWLEEHSLIRDMAALNEVLWFNPGTMPFNEAIKKISLGAGDVENAAARLDRFKPYIAKAFPETQAAGGLIESPLKALPAMQQAMQQFYGQKLPGQLLAKCDSHLPISGSVKARGGIYEILKHAETLAFKAERLSIGDDYSKLDSKKFHDFFSQHSIAVGSTGNLGLSIGIISARLGFHVTVHMSADAKQWKKDMLRSKGVEVLEYSSDYSMAVKKGREQAAKLPNCHFVDDENSCDLFLGYATAAERLKRQLSEWDIIVDKDHPLLVYLPCGVGGAPGGITFGLKLIFKDNVHCFFAEPTHAPCMLLGLYTGLHDGVSIGDFGIDPVTQADGLAVGRPSGFVGRNIHTMLDGAYTVSDEHLFQLLALMADSQKLFLEPSALAGFPGMLHVSRNTGYGQKINLKNAVHLAWCTGGSMVPQNEMQQYYERGKSLIPN